MGYRVVDIARIASAMFAVMVLGCSADAQTAPVIDTEDGTLGAVATGQGWLHPIISFDLRNGDFARGNYDDDRAGLDRLPAHVQIGLTAELGHTGDGEANAWMVLRSSNGLHAPSSRERMSPRAWYESNNLVGLVLSPMAGVRAAASYTIKTSPNGISSTTHEASVSVAYETKSGLGILHPSFVGTIRPKGGHGIYTQAGVEPELPLAAGDDAASLSLPAAIGVGWRSFYEAGSGHRLFGSAGLALSKPFTVGVTKWRARAEAVGLIRDRRLARLSGPDGETAMVIPLVTFALTVSY